MKGILKDMLVIQVIMDWPNPVAQAVCALKQPCDRDRVLVPLREVLPTRPTDAHVRSRVVARDEIVLCQVHHNEWLAARREQEEAAAR